MPDVPHGYDPVKLYHWLWWKLKCFEAQGTEFQQLFERVMPLVLGGDATFIPVRPYGNVGDKKNDGMIWEDGVIYAAYSPDEFKQADLVKKIKEDLEGAVAHWKDKGLRKWVFVYNVRRGLGPDVAGILAELRDVYDIHLEPLSSNDLWEQVSRLPLQSRCEVLGAPPGYEHLFLAGAEGDIAEHLRNGAFVVIQDVMSPINLADVQVALGERKPFGPPLRAKPGVQGEDWEGAARFQQALIQDAVERARDLLPRFAVFSLSPIPLAIHLGFLLSDRVEVEPYQYHRDRKTWEWPSKPGATSSLDMAVDAGDADSDYAVVRVSLSAKVQAIDVEPHASAPAVDLHLAVDDPDVDWLQKPEQLEPVTRGIRAALKEIRNNVPRCETIHLFVAAPTPVCVAIGQAINPRMNPEVLLYEYSRQRTPRYRPTIVLTEDLS